MSWISATDPLALVAIQAGQVGTPATAGAAAGNSRLDTEQASAEVGEPIPIVFARRRDGIGGVLISPKATECRFENNASNDVTAFYHLVLSEGRIDSIPVKDVFQRSCRVGSHTQTYDRRAGTWTPANALVEVPGYEKPEASYYCGSIGTYPEMSTLSFQVTIPNGFTFWDRQVHCFIRGGMYVTRLLDNTFGPSDNFADLVNWLLTHTNQVPSALIDTEALTDAATFLEYNKLLCNCCIKEAINYSDFIAKWAPYFLLGESNRAGKRGLRPLLPVTESGAIDTGVITPVFTFTEDNISEGTLEISYTSLAERRPFVAQIIWRQQLEDDFGITRTAEVKYEGTSEAGPYESHDLSEFCTSEAHAVKVGAYILARRVYTSHTIRFTSPPQAHNTLVAAGSIIQVKLARRSTASGTGYHNFLYQVQRITKTLGGEVSYECVHFPVDATNKSLIARDVTTIQPSGILLTSNKTGISCDINSSTDNSIPTEYWTTSDPIDQPSDIPYGGFADSSYTGPDQESNDGLDLTIPVWSGPGITGVPKLGETLTAPTICEGGVTRWWVYNPATGEREGNYLTTGQTFAIARQTALLGKGIGAEVICPGQSTGIFTPWVGPIDFSASAWNYYRISAYAAIFDGSFSFYANSVPLPTYLRPSLAVYTSPDTPTGPTLTTVRGGLFGLNYQIQQNKGAGGNWSLPYIVCVNDSTGNVTGVGTVLSDAFRYHNFRDAPFPQVIRTQIHYFTYAMDFHITEETYQVTPTLPPGSIVTNSEWPPLQGA